MLKEIFTDKKFINNVTRKFISWMINLIVIITVIAFGLSFMTEETFFDNLKFLNMRGIIRVTIGMILLITLSELFREYKKRSRI